MKSEMVVYVAGPYSGSDSWQREQNIRRAGQVAIDIMTQPLGWPCEKVAVICVHTQARFWYGAVAEDDVIAADMLLLERSDAVVLVTGWQWSKGTQAEIRAAAFAGKPIYEDVDAFFYDHPTDPEKLIERFDEEVEVPF